MFSPLTRSGIPTQGLEETDTDLRVLASPLKTRSGSPTPDLTGSKLYIIVLVGLQD